MNHQRQGRLERKIQSAKEKLKLWQDLRDTTVLPIERLEKELDDLEIELINLDLEEEEPASETEETKAFLNTEEGREQAQNEAEDMKAQEGQY
jgi:hypothetical protein